MADLHDGQNFAFDLIQCIVSESSLILASHFSMISQLVGACASREQEKHIKNPQEHRIFLVLRVSDLIALVHP